MLIKSAGTWVAPNSIKAKVSGSWVNVNGVWVKDTGVWKQVWPTGPTFTFEQWNAGFQSITDNQDTVKTGRAVEYGNNVWLFTTSEANRIRRSTNDGDTTTAITTAIGGTAGGIDYMGGTRFAASVSGSVDFSLSTNNGSSWGTNVNVGVTGGASRPYIWRRGAYPFSTAATVGIVCAGSGSARQRTANSGTSWSAYSGWYAGPDMGFGVNNIAFTATTGGVIQTTTSSTLNASWNSNFTAAFSDTVELFHSEELGKVFLIRADGRVWHMNDDNADVSLSIAEIPGASAILGTGLTRLFTHGANRIIVSNTKIAYINDDLTLTDITPIMQAQWTNPIGITWANAFPLRGIAWRGDTNKYLMVRRHNPIMSRLTIT